MAEDFFWLGPRIKSPLAGAILAQPLRPVLSAGKFDLAFGLRGNTVAGCRTVSPGPHRLQNIAIARDARAFENERAVNAPIGSDDKADSYFLAARDRGEKGIRCGQSFGRLNLFAGWPRVRHVDELRTPY